jgi:hypothetical protein
MKTILGRSGPGDFGAEKTREAAMVAENKTMRRDVITYP